MLCFLLLPAALLPSQTKRFAKGSCGCTEHGRDLAEHVEGCYEMSVGNADKGLMPIEEVKRRVQPFLDENLPLVLTQVFPVLKFTNCCAAPQTFCRMQLVCGMHACQQTIPVCFVNQASIWLLS